MSLFSSIAAHRVVNQRIEARDFTDPADIVRWMGAMQAQDYHQAVWALGARMAQPSLNTIEAALNEARIIRTWTQRGTIHFAPPEDVRWMLRVTAERMIAKDARRQAQLGLDVRVLAQCENVMAAALSGGKRLTRPEVLQTLEQAGISTEKQRGYHILWFFGQRGLIYIGAMNGKQQTFGLLDECAPNPREIGMQDAWAELARRYFRSHGMATVQDFAWWAGITLTEARAALDMIRDEVISETFDGMTYWHSATGAPPRHTEHVVLLPGFDEYFLGYKDRTDVIETAHQTFVCPGNNGVFFPMIVVDGQIVGTWKRSFRKDQVMIEPSVFPGHRAIDRSAFDAAAQRYADFHGLSMHVEAFVELESVL